jgi:Flp pilus assembly protein CpaB
VLLWRSRHAVAAIAVAVAAMVALGELRPPAPPTTPVAVLAAARPAGALLGSRDVVVRRVPTTGVPDGALRSADGLPGRRLAVGLPAGHALTPGVLVGPGLADGAPPGTVVVPVRLEDPGVARLLRAGDVIDLLRAPVDAAGPAAVVARRALVLARADDETGGILGGQDGSAPLLLVAVPRGAASLVSGAGVWAPLTAVLIAP